MWRGRPRPRLLTLGFRVGRTLRVSSVLLLLAVKKSRQPRSFRLSDVPALLVGASGPPHELVVKLL